MTAGDFDKLAILMRAYAQERMNDLRGPECEVCEGTASPADEHAGLNRPVCETVEKILDRAAALID